MSRNAVLENVRRYRAVASLFRQTAAFRPMQKTLSLAGSRTLGAFAALRVGGLLFDMRPPTCRGGSLTGSAECRVEALGEYRSSSPVLNKSSCRLFVEAFETISVQINPSNIGL